MFESTVKETEKVLDENVTFLDIISTLNKTSRTKASFGSFPRLNVL